jgi:hypothetical protein
MLMQLGAGVELATMVVPHFFLPLACAANVAKVFGTYQQSSSSHYKIIYRILIFSVTGF